MKTKSRFGFLITFIIISVIVAVSSGYFTSLQSYLESFVSANPSIAALIYNLIFIASTTFSFSVTVMTSIGVLFFSIPAVITYSIIGIMASSIIDFYIARKLGKKYVKNYLEKRGGRLEKFDKIIEKNTFKTTLLLSAIYFVPPAIPNFLGGIININLKEYAIATFIGNIPNTILTVYLVHGILYSNTTQVYISSIGLALISILSLFFYKGEIKELILISFPFLRRVFH